MPTSAPAPRTFVSSIDEYLGPAHGRFFGSGYRRVTYRLSELRIDNAATRVRARIAIGYPPDWSTKATSTPLRPHLSTVDALVIGARIGALALAGTPGLDAEARRQAWLSRVDIRAGAAPCEDGLDALPVVATRGATVVQSVRGEGAITEVDARVGSMTVRSKFVHPYREGASDAPPLALLAAETHSGPYGDSFGASRHHIRDVRLDPAVWRADALVGVESLSSLSAVPTVSMVDVFVVALQLGQVLLYELDGVERQRSNNLWMRSTTLTADGSPGATSRPFPVTARLADLRLLSKAGAPWRTTSIIADGLGMQTRCAVAHQLPESVLPAPAA